MLTFPLGDPTENMLLNSDILMQNGMYNNISSPASPAYGRGAGIPRLAGGNPQSYVEPYGYCGMVMNNPGYSMGMDQGCGMGMGSGGIGMSGLDEGGMSMGRYPRHHGMGNGLGGVMGGPLGLVTNMMENSVMDKSQPSHAYQGGPNVGHDRRFMAGDQSAAVKDSEAKVFKKVSWIGAHVLHRRANAEGQDAIYLIILNLPSDDELARFGSAF